MSGSSDNSNDASMSFYEYLRKNAHRIEYIDYLARGFQRGSAAMESLHRTCSQVRIKRSGAKWLAKTSQAVWDWRMLKLVGRWNEFWSRPNLMTELAANWDKEAMEYTLEDAD